MNQMDHVVYVVDDDPLVREALSIVRSRVREGSFKPADDV
jgi:FixJ family two-component response regulator